MNCLTNDLDPKISNVLHVITLIVTLSLPLLLTFLSGHAGQYAGQYADQIYTVLIVSVMFLAILQILSLFCKKTKQNTT
ncbi:MAG TPA: hypothetical protein PKD85_04265 [Saprospiraceae bacterium]|nr:hypothetical protein [Saprospiraceae bacterium]